MKSIFYIIGIVFTIANVTAQTTIPQCGFDELHQKELKTNPEYKKATEEANELIYKLTQQRGNKISNREVLTIPVVVHVMHLGEAEGSGSNISEAQILDGIDHLNDAFRNVGDYAGGPYFTDAGIASTDVEIEFCLAVRDPNGNPTSGIIRMQTDYSNLDRDEACDPPQGSDTQDKCMKALSFWDSHDYMNIWLVNEICTGTVAGGDYDCGTAGYAYLAGAHGQPYDGVVNEARYWGANTDDSKVHIHEVGHYLNLYHTFEGGCSETDCQTGGDLVCDTPPDNSTSAVACSNSETANTCSNDASIANSPFTTDVQDIYEDYMDYGYQSCQNTFTPGQKTRMRNTLTGIRSSLLDSDGCTPAQAPISDFTSDVTSGCVGVVVNYQDISANGTSSWDWTFPGGTPSSSTEQNPSITYNTAGTYDVTLIASNGVGQGTTETKNDYITVHDAIVAQCSISDDGTGTTGQYGIGIFNFKLEDIDNSSGSTYDDQSSYLDWTCEHIANLVPGSTYSFDITVGTTYDEDIRAYIDYNNDGDFDDSGEEIYAANDVQGVQPTYSLTTSSNAVVGTILTLRIVSDYAGSGTPSACTDAAYGQFEDYGVYFTSTLPTDLLSFEGKNKNNTIILNWETNLEKNNDFYLIMHSNDNIIFNEIAKIKCAKKVVNQYKYIHSTPNLGYNYYRLVQYNLDGRLKNLSTIQVYNKPNDAYITIEPNPINDNLLKLKYYSPIESMVIFEIIDIHGRVVIQSNKTVHNRENSISISVNNLKNGVYFLKTKQNSLIKTSRFIVYN